MTVEKILKVNKDKNIVIRYRNTNICIGNAKELLNVLGGDIIYQKPMRERRTKNSIIINIEF